MMITKPTPSATETAPGAPPPSEDNQPYSWVLLVGLAVIVAVIDPVMVDLQPQLEISLGILVAGLDLGERAAAGADGERLLAGARLAQHALRDGCRRGRRLGVRRGRDTARQDLAPAGAGPTHAGAGPGGGRHPPGTVAAAGAG